MIQDAATSAQQRTGRAISNTIAGLIVFTFIAITLIPLLLNIFISNTQGSIELAQLLAHRVAAAQQGLNITLDVNQSLPPTKIYIITNNAAHDRVITVLSIEDDNGNIYLIRPGACINNTCSAGTATIKVTAPSGSRAERLDLNVLLHPRDTIIVTITHGDLLGAALSSGAYVKPYVPPITSVPQQVQYAAVAGSVKTNYFRLNNVADVSQLVTSSDIALVTSPFANETNTSILWRGVIQSLCLVDQHPEIGGFQPLEGLNQTHLDALFIANILPYGGSIAIGGTKIPYTEPGYGSGVLYTAYGYMAYNSSTPMAVIARMGLQWIAVLGMPDKIESGNFYMIPLYGNEASSTFNVSLEPADLNTSLIKLEKYLTDTITGYVKDADFDDSSDIHVLVHDSKLDTPIYMYIDLLREEYNYSVAWLDTRTFGLLLYLFHYFIADPPDYSKDPYSVLIYCPPQKIDRIGALGSSILEVNISGCPAIAIREGSSNFYLGHITSASLWFSKAHVKQLDEDIYISNDNVTISISKMEIVLTDELKDEGSISKPSAPYRVKFSGNTYMLTLYDAYTYTLSRNSSAFGLYFYADNKDILDNELYQYGEYKYYPEYVFIGYDLYNVTLSVFSFRYGVNITSGIMPYIALLDTDGNGLKEIVFLGEDTGYGTAYSIDSETPLYLADIKAGCLDKTLTPLYLKFVGDRYAVDGSQIAEISMQIRYTFHDSASDDINDVENPRDFIMSFQLITPNNTIFMTSDYIYQQLAGLEDTWPPNHNWVSDSVFLLVPNKKALYRVVFAINDPYGGWIIKENDDELYYVTNDDLDYTLSVEWLGMWYLHR